MGQWIFVESKSEFDIDYGNGCIKTVVEITTEEWPVNTPEEIEVATWQMRAAGMISATVFDDMGSEENYRETSLKIFA